MARYWVGGTGNWSDTAHWSTSSGGDGGYTAPATNVDAFFDGNSGTGTCTVNSGGLRVCLSLDCTGYTGTIAFGTNLWIYGNCTLATGMTVSGSSGIYFQASTGSFTFDSKGKTVAQVLKYNGGTLSLSSDITVTSWFGLYGGVFNANGKNITANMLYADAVAALTVNMGSGTFTVTGSDGKGAVVDVRSAVTFNCDTSTLKMTDTSSSTKTIDVEAHTLNVVQLEGGGTGTFTFIDGCTINDLYVNPNATAVSVKFEAGETFTLGDLRAVGSSGKLIKLYSTSAGTQYTLTTPNTEISCDYLDLKDSNATEADTWYAGVNSSDTSNNDGWIFTAQIAGKTLTETVTVTEYFTRELDSTKLDSGVINETYEGERARDMSETTSVSEVFNVEIASSKIETPVNVEEAFSTILTYVRNPGDNLIYSETVVLDINSSFMLNDLPLPLPHKVTVTQSERGVFHQSITGTRTWDLSSNIEIIKMGYDVANLSDSRWTSIFALYDNHLSLGTGIYFESGILDFNDYVLMDVSDIKYLIGKDNDLVKFEITFTKSNNL